jgi:hypothetical protein
MIYGNDRVIDRTAAFYARLRAMSPRAQRLRAARELHAAALLELHRTLMGGLMLALIFLVLAAL